MRVAVAHVQRRSDGVEGGKEGTHEVRVPHPDRVLDANLAHEETVHPPEGELHELYVLRIQVCCQWCCIS